LIVAALLWKWLFVLERFFYHQLAGILPRKKRETEEKVHCILLMLPWQANAKEMCAIFRKNIIFSAPK
jgi:hypothetical protein